MPWGNNVTVSGRLTHFSSGSGIAGASITFDGTGAENIPDVVTNVDGTFTAKGSSPNAVATGWKVQAHYAGNSGYQPSNSLIKTYSTTKHGVALTLFVSPTSLTTGQPYTVGTTLKDFSANVAY